MTADYAAIREWHKSSGSKDYYIFAQVEKARAEHAPEDAIYRRDGGEWARVSDLAPDHKFRLWYESEVVA